MNVMEIIVFVVLWYLGFGFVIGTALFLTWALWRLSFIGYDKRIKGFEIWVYGEDGNDWETFEFGAHMFRPIHRSEARRLYEAGELWP